MSNLNSASRVVSLNSLGQDRSPGFRILGECRDQLVTLLGSWLGAVATPVSEELLNLADSARDRELQTRYINLRADIEKDWPQLIETYRRELSSEADRCLRKQNPDNDLRSQPLGIPDFEGLQLMADEDLSQHIVTREFSIQVAESCDEELYTLSRRVATLLGQEEPNDSANPLSPSIICSALSDACASIGADAENRLILLRRLERHLRSDLPEIYRQINAYLIERGILPELRRSYRRTSSGGGSVSSGPPAGYSGGSGGGGSGGGGVGGGGGALANDGPGFSGEGVMEALQKLALSRMGGIPATPAGPMIPAPAGYVPMGTGIPAPQLDIAAINQLLQSSLSALPLLPASQPDGVIVNQVRAVRESENAQQVGGLASVTIDIVAMLFDFIFDDAHIPVAIKALLSRLQIPVLKVAMMNPGFFSDRQHPTRRFLGSVSGISIRWGHSVDESDPFYRKLSELVDRIQTGFEDDIEVFGTALAELEAFVAENESEEDTTALTAANLVIQREQESERWDRAQKAVRSFRMEKVLPVLIDQFLSEHWVGVLQTSAAADENAEKQWQSAIDTMKDLAWSIEAKKLPEDRQKLIRMLPGLLAALNRGLDGIGIAEAARNAFFDGLVKYHSAALKGEARPEPEIPTAAPAPKVSLLVSSIAITPETGSPVSSSPDSPNDPNDPAIPGTDGQLESAPLSAPPAEDSEEGDLLVMRSVDNGVEVEEVMLVGAAPIWRADDREIFRQVSALRRGDWVEFRDEDHIGNRVRLHWISPQRGLLLFSNHRSAKAISIAPEALARQIRDGKAEIVRETQLFERALSGALEKISE